MAHAGVTIVSPQYTQVFNEHEKKYKCCCGCCQVKIGTLIIGILAFLGVLGAIYPYGDAMHSLNGIDTDTAAPSAKTFLNAIRGAVIVFLVIYAIMGIACICLFISMCVENQYLLIPFMVVQILEICWTVLLMIGVIIVLIMGATLFDALEEAIKSSSQQGAQNADKLIDLLGDSFTVICIVFIVIFLITILIQVWFFTVVRACYVFFKDKKNFYKNGGAPTVQYTSTPVGYPNAQMQPGYGAGYGGGGYGGNYNYK